MSAHAWRTFVVLLIFAGSSTPSRSEAQATAYVRAGDASGTATGDHGAAILFTRGDACFAVTPLHVLANDMRGTRANYAQLVVARVGSSPVQAQADLCAAAPEMDLALLRVSGVPRATDCGGPLLGAPTTDALLAANADAWLGTTSESGRVIGSALVKRAVSSGDATSFYVSSAASQDRLTEGMSGSLVAIRDQPVGMLLSVDNRPGNPNAGAARILRLDGIATRVNRLFASRTDAETINAACFASNATTATGARSAAPTARGNLASTTCGARAVAWSIAPSSEVDRPENLVGAGTNGVWRTRGSGEVTVDLQLCPSTTGTVSSLTLDTSPCRDGENDGYDVEALVRGSARGAYATLSFGHVPKGGRLNLDSGAPLKATELRLRFVARGTVSSGLCVAPLVVR